MRYHLAKGLHSVAVWSIYVVRLFSNRLAQIRTDCELCLCKYCAKLFLKIFLVTFQGNMEIWSHKTGGHLIQV